MQNDKYIRLGLSENHNLPSKKIIEEIQKESKNINLYPDTDCIDLRNAIARCVKLNEKQIYIGNGLDEVILSIYLGLGIIRKKVIVSEHTFMGYFHCASLLQNEIIEIPNKNHYVNIDSIIKVVQNTNAPLVFICNPHNPLGTVIEKNKIYELARICKQIGTYLVIDEAYIEYIDKEFDVTKDIDEYNTLIVLRTLSKAYGLAGLRCGYACADEDVIMKMEVVKKALPFSVNRIAQKAVVCALSDGERVQEIQRINLENLQWTKEKLKELGIIFTDSQTNFISIYYKETVRIISFLENKYHILVKDLSSMGMKNWIRISIGSREQMKLFIEAMGECVNKYGYEQ